MKTLDEVIEELEDFLIEDEGMFADALHYLKEYQKILPLIPSLINTAIAVQKKGKTIG